MQRIRDSMERQADAKRAAETIAPELTQRYLLDLFTCKLCGKKGFITLSAGNRIIGPGYFATITGYECSGCSDRFGGIWKKVGKERTEAYSFLSKKVEEYAASNDLSVKIDLVGRGNRLTQVLQAVSYALLLRGDEPKVLLNSFPG